MNQEGTPVEQPVVDAMRFVDSEGFARRHRGCSEHLAKALDLLRSDRTDEQTVSELGGHLRNSFFDLVADLIGDDANYDREKPEKPLRSVIDAAAVSDREKTVLGTLVDALAAVLSLDQRLTHIRDEGDQKRQLRSWDELRRAVFTTIYICAELDRALS